MNLEGAFWRFAHNRYHARKPSILFEVWLFLVGGFFLVAFLASFISGGPKVTNYVAALLIWAVPLLIGFMHRRIRIERAKGRDALYRKRLTSNR